MLYQRDSYKITKLNDNFSLRARWLKSLVFRNVPVKSKLQYPPPGNPPGIWIFGKFVFKFPPPRAEKLFKCPHPHVPSGEEREHISPTAAGNRA